ncbi:negative regulator of flagellin synthesis FlgM [Nitrosomonas sp. Nm51]|uniref:flagellar biosynthesis anti-sigma factor FlgM n=1 Tax=Nitrosomonas sp. Nm51 TaxID=133720 RepID=UPI0008CA8404|nr:flagellar biosynthesis anti-sigma factor FlgM [Nitrosomonas sp. Nm51]SER27914.1 negative regulator of flagellin synthesis FlgM [Nitrosomonas sp. Nm51]
MKVDNSIQSVTNVSSGDVKKRSESATSSSSIHSENANSAVHISAHSTNLKAAENVSNNEAIVDLSRVQEIKSAISEGTFKVNPDVIADRLLETAKELIQSKERHS